MKVMQILTMNKNNFIAQLYKNVKVIRESAGSCVVEMKVEREHQNPDGFLHGAVCTVLVDVFSSVVMATMTEGKLGVTVDLSVKFLNSGQIGDRILIDAKVLKLGKRLSFMNCDILEKVSGKVIAQGRTTTATIYK